MTKQKTKIQKVKNLLVSLFRERRDAFGGFIKTGTAKLMGGNINKEIKYIPQQSSHEEFTKALHMQTQISMGVLIITLESWQ